MRFVQHVSDVPPTNRWRRGRQVRGGNVPPGTIIATFDPDGTYSNRVDGSAHAAVLIAENADGLLIWDQWIGQPVHQRVVRFREGGNAANNGNAFHVVEIET